MEKSIFKYDSELYRHVDMAETMPGLRKEYSRLRQIAQKRLSRLERAGYGNSEIYLDYEDMFQQTRVLSDAEIAEIMPDLYNFQEWVNFLEDIKNDDDFRYNEELDDIKGAATAEQRAEMRAARIARIEQRFNEYLRDNYY